VTGELEAAVSPRAPPSRRRSSGWSRRPRPDGVSDMGLTLQPPASDHSRGWRP